MRVDPVGKFCLLIHIVYASFPSTAHDKVCFQQHLASSASGRWYTGAMSVSFNDYFGPKVPFFFRISSSSSLSSASILAPLEGSLP